MNQDDIIYVLLLLASVVFSYYYRTLGDSRKPIGFLVGLFLSAVVSKYHLVHLVLSVLACACIILFTSKRLCHVIGFFTMFSYLLFVRIYIQVRKLIHSNE